MDADHYNFTVPDMSTEEIMSNDKTTPNWKYPVILSILLVAAIIAWIPVMSGLEGRAAFVVGRLWHLANLALAWVAWASWKNQIKMVESFSSPKHEKYRSSVPFFVVCLFIAIGSVVSYNLFGAEKFQGSSNMYLLGLFGIIWAILITRAILMGLVARVSGKKDESESRILAGYADGILLAGIAVSLFLRLDSHHIRFTILAIVITSIRVGWGYVPEERLEIVREFFLFLKERKLWWMTPIFIILGLMVVLVLLTEVGGGAFPFIYAVF